MKAKTEKYYKGGITIMIYKIRYYLFFKLVILLFGKIKKVL